MKRILTTALAVMLVITATLTASAQTEQTRKVSDFNGIASTGSFNIHVTMGGTESLKLSAPADIINDIETIVEHNKLAIRFKRDKDGDNKNWNSDGKKIEVYITAKALSSLSITGSGSINVADLKTTDMHAAITGSGSIKIDGNAETAHFVVTGSGEISAKGFKTNSASITIAGSGSANIYADKSISASIAGSGSVVYSGNAKVNKMNTAGSGSIRKAGE